MNAELYNTAFTALERELILTTLVDNSVASTGYETNQYACENTSDKVFLLSYAEAVNSAYDLTDDASRQMQTGDYSRAMGAYLNKDDYYGNGYWLLRSPGNNYPNYARGVFYSGHVNYEYGVSDSDFGVLPALRISLS